MSTNIEEKSLAGDILLGGFKTAWLLALIFLAAIAVLKFASGDGTEPAHWAVEWPMSIVCLPAIGFACAFAVIHKVIYGRWSLAGLVKGKLFQFDSRHYGNEAFDDNINSC